MNKVTIAVIQYPGSNCEYETARAIRSVGMMATIFRWNRDHRELKRFQGYVLPGGFSYQDRVRAGAVAAKKSIIRTIMEEAEAGKPVLGICNGAQILVEAGMIPGLNWGQVEMALSWNVMPDRTGFYCDWVHLLPSKGALRCAFTSLLEKGRVFPLPIAHAEGRFVTQNEGLLEDLIKRGQIVLRYCDRKGEVSEDFPINPNGSLMNIAGICNPKGNVLAMMPHPERATFLRQVPDDLMDEFSDKRLEAIGRQEEMEGEGPGRRIFLSMRKYIEKRECET